MLICVWGLGKRLILKGKREKNVSKNYIKGIFEMCAAQQIVFGCEMQEN